MKKFRKIDRKWEGLLMGLPFTLSFIIMFVGMFLMFIPSTESTGKDILSVGLISTFIPMILNLFMERE